MVTSEIILALFWIIAAFWISKVIVPVLILVAKESSLYDEPDCSRKIHIDNMPTLGGVAIFTAILVSFSASSFAEGITGYGYLIAGSIVLFTSGIKDDILGLSPIKKLVAQLISSSLVIFGTGIYFQTLGGVFGVENISPWIGIPLTYFTIICVINAFNFVDGIDSLAGGIAIISASFFGYWFYIAGLYSLAVFSGIIVASILGFLWHNRPPAKIFMGDTGSLILGFYLAVLAIKFINSASAVPSVVIWQPAAAVLVIASLIVPIYDILRVVTLRTIRGKSPFAPDRTHVHHHLLDAGFSHGQASLFLFLVNIFILSFAILFSQYVSNTLLLASVVLISMIFFPTNRFKRKFIRSFSLRKKTTEIIEWSLTDTAPDPEILHKLESQKNLEQRNKVADSTEDSRELVLEVD